MKKTVLTFCAIIGLGLGAMAQGSTFWTPQATGFATASRGLRDISTPSATVSWAIAYDGVTPTTPITEFTRTINGGTTWTAGDIGALASGYAFSNLSALDANTAWVAMYNNATSSGGRLLKTADGGVTWTQQATGTYTNAASFLNIVHMFNATNGFMQGDPAGGYFEIYTTTNGGTTWTRVPQANIPAPLTGEYGTVDVYSTVGNNIIYFGTNKGRVFKSVDAGLNWTVTGATGLTTIEDVVFSSATNGLAREGQDLVRTTNGGTTWTQVSYTGTMYGNDLTYVPGTANTYVSSGNNTTTVPGGSSYSVNGGSTWVDYDTGLSRLKLSFFSPTVGYAAGFSQTSTSGGIFKFTGTVASVSGISNPEFSKNILVFPNPSKGIIHIAMEKGTGSSIAINVFDAVGRTVFTKTDALNGGTYNNQIDLNNLTKGVYMLQVQTGENISMRKIVIE